MKRPVLLIAGIVAAALVFAGSGASAHTGHLLSKLALTNTSVLNDETPSQPSETPETQASEPAEAPDTETPEPQASEPAEGPDIETPEPQASEPAEAPDTEAADNDEQGEETGD